MRSLTFEIGNTRGRLAGFYLRGLLLAVLIAFGTMLPESPAEAACGLSGKALYNCMATKLERKADMVGSIRGDPQAPVAAQALRTAASQLRAATTKAAALSAITQARSAISSVIQQAKAGGRDSQGYGAIANTLSEMASEIQKKG
jgi:hypothetical protein